MRMDSSFDRWRKSQAGYAPLFYESLMRPALDHLSGALKPGAVVLDAGCGQGHLAWALSVHGARGIGIDHRRNSDWPEWAKRGPVQFVDGSVEALPLRTAAVDALLCFSVLQYVERELALDEFARVLKPGASFALVENLDRNPAAVVHRLKRRESRRYLSWGEVAAEDRRFSEWRSIPFALLSPLLLAWPGSDRWTADAPGGAWTRRVTAAVEGCDRLSFANLPGSPALAWLVLTLGKR